jgi:hypothetical protein
LGDFFKGTSGHTDQEHYFYSRQTIFSWITFREKNIYLVWQKFFLRVAAKTENTFLPIAGQRWL